LKKTTLLIILIVLGVLCAMVGAYRRFSLEQHNRRVETVVDYTDALNLSLAARLPFDQTLQQLHDAGITSLAIWEDNLDNLRAVTGAMTEKAISPTETVLTFSPGFPGQEQRVIAALQHKTHVTFQVQGDTLDVNAPYTQISSLGVGMDPNDVARSLRMGFYICPRLYNYPGATPDSIQWMLDTANAQCQGKATVLMFNGPDVLGNRGDIDATAQAITTDDLHYGSIEFGKQIGDEDLSRAAADHTVRVHSIAGAEMPTMEEPTAVARFALAARERNIRVLYIRLFQNGLTHQPDVMQANLQYIGEIVQSLHDGGLRLGKAHSFSRDPLTETGERILLALMGIGVIAGLMLLIRQFTGLDGNGFWILFAILALGGAYMAIRHHTALGREGLALLAGMTFPSLGLIRCRMPKAKPNATPFQALEQAFRRFEAMTLWTLAGVALVIGLLADRLFMLKVDEYVGIRLAMVTPLLFTLLYYGFKINELPEEAPFADRTIKVGQEWRRFLGSPLQMGQVVLGLIALALVVVIVLRSGNDPGVGVSSTELSFRNLLNRILFVRPRTKEFAFGYPLLVLGLALAATGRRNWLLIFLCAGAIAQADLLDTFCHIHTPLLISVIRSLLGWILGAFFGAVLYLLYNRFFPTGAVVEADRPVAPEPESSPQTLVAAGAER
jgi:hypothetical protein